ncbi:MAG: hypothetical protein WBG33_06135, partial [Rhodanobacter sp.]
MAIGVTGGGGGAILAATTAGAAACFLAAVDWRSATSVACVRGDGAAAVTARSAACPAVGSVTACAGAAVSVGSGEAGDVER